MAFRLAQAVTRFGKSSIWPTHWPCTSQQRRSAACSNPRSC